MSNSNPNPPIYRIANSFKNKWLWLAGILIISISGISQNPGYTWKFGSTPPFVSTSVGGASGSHSLTLLGQGASAISVVNEAVGLGTSCTGPIDVGTYGGEPDNHSFGLKFNNSPQFISNVYTIELVVKFFTSLRYHRLAGFYDLGGSGAEKDYGIYISPDNYDARISFYNGASQTIGTTADSISGGTWYHIVLVRDTNKQISVYRNGASIGQFVDSADQFLPHAGSGNAITFFKDDDNDPFTNEETGGNIAKLSVYNTVLTGTQIQQLFNNACDTTTSPPSGGTASYIPKYVTSGTFDSSVIYQKDGSIGIGTTNVDTSYKLFVEKGIRTRLVQVDIDVWPDFVFDKKYKLPSLKEIEQHIKEYKHLPGIPPAAEIEEKGLNVGKNQAALMQKIEELTLYIIEQNKKAEEMNAMILELKKEMQGVKEKIK